MRCLFLFHVGEESSGVDVISTTITSSYQRRLCRVFSHLKPGHITKNIVQGLHTLFNTSPGMIHVSAELAIIMTQPIQTARL